MKNHRFPYVLSLALLLATTVRAQSDLTPQRIEVAFAKTLHILFPAPVTYIDIGSAEIIAGKAAGAGNVVRVKAAVRDFEGETNLTVITEDGGFYTFDARYAENPSVSTIEIHAELSANASEAPAAAAEGHVLLEEVGREKPAVIRKTLAEIYRLDRDDVRGIRTKKYGIEVEVKGIYAMNDVIYIHVQIANASNISFEIDYRRFIVADRKLAKRTAQQQTSVEPLRVCNDVEILRARQRQRVLFALPKLTIPDDKVLLLEVVERNGARHQTVEITSKELLAAEAL